MRARIKALLLTGALALSACVVAIYLCVSEPSERALVLVPKQDAPSVTASAEQEVSAPLASGDGARTSSRCLVRVVGARGVPIEGCEVLGGIDGLEGLRRQVSDGSGLVQFPAVARMGWVAAVAGGGLWAAKRIDWTGEHTLVLGGDALVAGTALVDGEPAPDGLQMNLLTQGVEAPEGFPLQLLESLRASTRPFSAATSAGGYFAFSGLPANWRGWLVPPANHWFVPRPGQAWQSDRMEMEASSANLLVWLTQLPCVRGRVVWDDDGSPVAAANVGALAKCEGGLEANGGCKTGPNGSFVVGLVASNINQRALWADVERRPHVLSVKVACTEDAGTVREGGEVEIVGSDLRSRSVELRLRRLVVGDEVHFLVMDAHGMPIAGARVNVTDSTASDAHGRGRYRGGKATLIGALGYCVVPAVPERGDGSVDDPMCFVLPDANALTIIVDGQSDSLAFHKVLIESSVPIMAGIREWHRFDGEFGGSECASGQDMVVDASGVTKQVAHLWVTIDEKGRATIPSLEPGIECAVTVRDQLGSTVARADCRTPPIGGKASVTLVIDKSPRRIQGVVTDIEGKPLAGAEVRLSAGGESILTSTAEEGAFQFPAVYSDDPVEVSVLAPGYVLSRRVGILRSVPEQALSFRLESGRPVTVHVYDRAGQLVDLFAKPSGFEDLQPQAVGTGGWMWPDLPRFVEFYTLVQGRRFSAQYDGNDSARIEVPVLGRVVAPISSFPISIGWDRANGFVELREIQHPDLEVVRLPFRDEFQPKGYVLPGTYSAALVQRRRTESGVVEFWPCGIETTLAVPAGVLTRVTFE